MGPTPRCAATSQTPLVDAAGHLDAEDRREIDRRRGRTSLVAAVPGVAEPLETPRAGRSGDAGDDPKDENETLSASRPPAPSGVAGRRVLGRHQCNPSDDHAHGHDEEDDPRRHQRRPPLTSPPEPRTGADQPPESPLRHHGDVNPTRLWPDRDPRQSERRSRQSQSDDSINSSGSPVHNTAFSPRRAQQRMRPHTPWDAAPDLCRSEYVDLGGQAQFGHVTQIAQRGQSCRLAVHAPEHVDHLAGIDPRHQRSHRRMRAPSTSDAAGSTPSRNRSTARSRGRQSSLSSRLLSSTRSASNAATRAEPANRPRSATPRRTGSTMTCLPRGEMPPLTRTDAQFVAQVLRNHHLALRADDV